MPYNRERALFIPKEMLRPNEIPAGLVFGKNIPEAWENLMCALDECGAKIQTQYDQEIDPKSKDASVTFVVANPLSEPRIHKSIPTGLDELWIYGQEIVNGLRDYKIVSKEEEQGWSYSYHDRLVNWPGTDARTIGGVEIPNVDQLAALVDNLVQTPYTRRAQAITWNPLKDVKHHEPPCLQRIWGRLVDSDMGEMLLEMNTHWRSNDVYKATLMNTWGLTELQKELARQISERTGKRVVCGRYVAMIDSAHLYGSYERRGELTDFFDALSKRSFAERTYRSDDPVVLEQFDFGRERLEKELADLKK